MADFELVHGDIADAEADAIVNAWNRNFIPHWLLVPQGVSKALRKRGGREIFRQVRRFGLLPVGGAVATDAGNLKATWVIHVAALHAYWTASTKSVSLGAKNAFQLAADLGARSMAMPLLGAGTGGITPERSLELIRAAWTDAPAKPESVRVFVHDGGVYQRCTQAGG